MPDPGNALVRHKLQLKSIVHLATPAEPVCTCVCVWGEYANVICFKIHTLNR